MKIWKLDSDMNEYESFKLKNEDKEFLRSFKKEMSNGEPKKGKFDNLELEVIDVGKLSDLPQFWNYAGALLFSERAKKSLEAYLEESVEFILMKYNNLNYYLVNVTKIIDGIDYDSAKLRKLDTGLVVGLDKYAFKENEIEKLNMFKVLLNGKIHNSEIYISSYLKEKIDELKLEGFQFTKVWDLEE